jgi:hypothetical protein
MELSTSRLLLREFCAGDHAAVHAFASDTEVTRYTDWGPNSPHDTTAFLTEVVRDSRSLPRSRFALAVVDREDDLIIGSIELRITSGSHKRAEVGYVLARPWWGGDMPAKPPPPCCASDSMSSACTRSQPPAIPATPPRPESLQRSACDGKATYVIIFISAAGGETV